MNNDGDIDYSKYDTLELREALQTINPLQYPLNYQNLVKALESRVGEGTYSPDEYAPDAQHDILRVSGKTAEKVIEEYGDMRAWAGIVSVAVFILCLPNAVVEYTSNGTLFGLGGNAWFAIAAGGAALSFCFGWLYWKCPNCGLSPGVNPGLRSCKYCGVRLVDAPSIGKRQRR